jgi:uncharacterized protein (TIGR03437 family)
VKTAEKSVLSLGMMLLAVMCSFDTGWAQSNTLSANPQQLTFNTQTGVTPTQQALLLSSSNGPTSVTVKAFSNNSWLTVSPTSGTTPLLLTVSVGASAPASGTDVGFLNISSAGSFIAVPIILNANSSGASSVLSANPTSLSFGFPASPTLPISKTITVSSSSSSVTSFTATPITSDGGNWLTVSPVSGNLTGSPLSGQLQVTVNPGSLTGAGPFNAVVAINAPGTTGISLPVLVTIAGTPAIEVSPGQFSFGFQIGTTPPAAQTLAITSSTGANVSFTATAKPTTCGNSWLILSQQSGATPSSINVEVNQSGLNAGTCTGEIDISAPGASNPDVVVPVSLLVSTTPLLQVPSTVQPFTYQLGSNTQPAAQNVQITSSTPGLGFTATATPVSGGPNFLEVTPSGTTPQALMLSINAAALPSIGPGTYSETVSVAAAGAGNSPQTFTVTLAVSSTPNLTANVQSLHFNHQIGQTAPSNQTITVGSTGAPLNYQVAVNTTSCPGFLTATPANGSTLGLQNQVVVSVATSGITPQACGGNITLSVPGTTTPPLVIPVTLNVSNTALLNVSQAAINVTALTGSAAMMQQISVTSTDPNTALSFTATAATSPIGLTWLAVAPNSGNTPANLQVIINPANLLVGTYTGSITVSSSAPNVPSQTIPVTLVIASSSVSAGPTSLTFTQSLGGSAPPSQTVQISGVPGGTTIGAIPTMLNGTGWLSTSVAGSVVTVTADGAQLQQGQYSGVVTVVAPGAANSPLNILVTLNVGPPSGLSLSPTSVSFGYQAGSSVFPVTQSVELTSTMTNASYTATFTPTSGGNFVTVTPTSGNTPASLNVAVNSAVAGALATGKYSGTITVSSPDFPGGNQTINVTLTVTAPGVPVVASLKSAASFQPGSVSPGEIVAIFGAGIGPATPVVFTPVNGKVQTTLGNVTVTLNGVQAPLLYVSATQINCIVPYEMAGQPTVNVVVEFEGVPSASFQANVVDTTPAIFAASESGNGQGAILSHSLTNHTLTPNSASNPAPKGTNVAIYATGEGQLVPGVATGSITAGVLPVPKPIAIVSVKIGGQVAQIQYAGEAPGLVSGVIQINATIPTNIASGNQPVVLTIGGNTNVQQNITVAVQ